MKGMLLAPITFQAPVTTPTYPTHACMIALRVRGHAIIKRALGRHWERGYK